MQGLSYIRRYASAGKLAGLCLLNFLLCAMVMGVALLLSLLLDTISNSATTGDLSALLHLIFIACLYALIVGILSVIVGYLKASIIKNVMVGIREGASRGLLFKNTAGTSSSADQLTLLGQSMDTLENDWLGGMADILNAAFSIAIGCVLLVCLNPLIALISLIGMALPTLVPQLFSKRLADQQQQIISDTAAYNGRVRDTAQGNEVIKSFHAESFILEKLNEAAKFLQGHKESLTRTTVCISGFSGVVGVAVQFIIMGITGIFVVKGFVTIGSVVAVTQLSGSVISPATELSNKLSKLKATYPILDRLAELDGAAHSDTDATTHQVDHSLALDHASFSYDGNDTQVVKNCTARFDAGRKYAICGQSGCGKSTLLGLLSGMHAPSSGTLLVDGEANAIPDVAFVHQNVFLFDGTLRENITLGGSFSDAAISQAMHLAKLDDAAAALPQGLDTPVSENGTRLSSGERQRVAIARALLYSKRTLLVDEATSALDRNTAAQVEDALLSLDGVTVIAVTHHLDKTHAARYDKVLTMKNGHLQDERQGDRPLVS